MSGQRWGKLEPNVGYLAAFCPMAYITDKGSICQGSGRKVHSYWVIWEKFNKDTT